MSPAPTSHISAPSHAIHPSVVLSAYLEPLVRGRRVAILGDASIGLAERLIERGTRLVHAYDPDAGRVAEAIAHAAGRHPHPTFAVLEGDLGVRDGAFDAVIVPDLSLFEDAAEVLRRARRLVSDAGAAIFAAPNPDAPRALVPAPSPGRAGRGPGPDYYTLYDLVSLQFRVVRMIGQAPFVGYTVAAFAQEGEPEVSVDMSLLSASEEPEWFIALASERPIRLDSYTVVELPLAELPALVHDRGAAAAAPVPSIPPEALAQAEARAARLELELADLRARCERERESEEARVEARAEAGAAASARIAELEAELAERAARLKEIEARAGDEHVRAERNAHKIRDLDEELRTQRDRAARLAKQLDDEKKARTRVELELGMVRNKPEIVGSKDRIDALSAELDEARARIAALSVAAGELAAARARIAGLEAAASELAAARARVSELEARLAAPPRPDPALMLRVEELESAIATAKRELARITGERDAARSRVEALERSLEEERRKRSEAAERLGAIEAQRQELSRAKQALEERAARLDREQHAREEQRGAREAGLLARVEALSKQVAALAAEREALAAEREALAGSEDRVGEAAAAELSALEEALRDRGRVIARLEAELRESERVGRELVEELGAIGGLGGGGAPGGGNGGGARGAVNGARPDEAQALRQQLASLAHGAARCEADLQAAQWRIAKLDRELSAARDASRTPARVHEELEQALVAARAELDTLRRAARRTPPEVPPAVIEQSVLLHQVASAAP